MTVVSPAAGAPGHRSRTEGRPVDEFAIAQWIMIGTATLCLLAALRMFIRDLSRM